MVSLFNNIELNENVPYMQICEDKTNSIFIDKFTEFHEHLICFNHQMHHAEKLVRDFSNLFTIGDR